MHKVLVMSHRQVMKHLPAKAKLSDHNLIQTNNLN